MDSRVGKARNGVRFPVEGTDLFEFEAAFKGDLATSNSVAMTEKGVKRGRPEAERSKFFSSFSNLMRLSELDTLEQMLGEAEYALSAGNMRSGVEACE